VYLIRASSEGIKAFHICLSHPLRERLSNLEQYLPCSYLGTTLTNKNSIQEEIKSRLKFGECLLLFGTESSVFQFAIQKVKDQVI